MSKNNTYQFTETDVQRGLVKVSWKDIRERVRKVEPTFTKLVDELDPDHTFPLYLAYLPYGDLKGDTESPFIPNVDGGYYRLSDPHAPSDVIKHLGYGKNSSPLGMVLEKEFEYFIDLKDEGVSVPWAIYTPGTFFSFGRNLGGSSNRTYAPNGILSVTAGLRSIFMLPNIGSAMLHSYIQRDINIHSSVPKSLNEHWAVFKEISDSKILENNWRACIIYFSHQWIDKLHNDQRWLSLKLYFHELAWNYFEFDRSRIYYDIAFSRIQKTKHLRPNPFLTDTAKHLFAIAMGDAPGYAPAINEDGLPVSILQKVYVESYGLKKYIPTIMQPTRFIFEKDTHPIYYSLQNPSTSIFSPTSRTTSTVQLEIRELQHIMNTFKNELTKENFICSGTILNEIANNIDFNYYHNKNDQHKVMRLSDELPIEDERLNFSPFYKGSEAKFSADAPFMRGCIRIAKKI